MGKSKATIQKFEKINKATLKLKGKRTRSGASAERNRTRAHSKHHKHR